MTSTVTEITKALATHPVDATAAAVIAVVLLIALAAEQEVVRAASGASAGTWTRPFRLFIAPLLLAFVLIVVARFLALVP